MVKKKINWVRVVFLFVATALLIYVTYVVALLVWHDYCDWQTEKWYGPNVYEAIWMMFSSLQFLILSGTLLFFTARALVRSFRTSVEPDRATELVRRRGVGPAAVSAGVFLIFAMTGVILLKIISDTPEVSEAPATYSLRMLYGWVVVAAELAFENAVIMLVLWIREKVRKKKAVSDISQEEMNISEVKDDERV